jgi:geranylgeranyl pyrophosphate synthase
MRFRTYPRLKLRGTVGGKAVTGEAWLDHQWGGPGWMISEGPRRRVLGWNWFGINLNDGSDWVLLARTDAQTRDVILPYVIRRDAAGEDAESHELSLQPAQEWESPRTAIRYPLEWRVEIPRLKASLVVSALAPDQEIPLFGLQRAVWEGAATVRGTVAGRSVQGKARVELQGYGYVFDFRDVLKNFAGRIDRHLEDFLPRHLTDRDLRKYVGPPSHEFEPAAYNRMLSEPVWDMISRPGKRWRPIFALLLLDSLGQDPGPYEGLVSALAELCHTGSLIVDDIEDASLVRRGQPCLHLKYGQDVAINAANTLYFLPSLLIFDHPLLSKVQRLEIHEVMTRQYIRAHFGQALDLYWSRHLDQAHLRLWRADSLAAKILQMYELKTAAPLEGLAEAVAIVAQSRPGLRNACRRCASAVGTAFQIIDDVHGISRDGSRKTVGEDLVGGKMTYVLFRALEKLKTSDRRRLETIICSENLRREKAGLAEGVELIQKSGALESCQSEAEEMLDQGWECVSGALKPSEPKILLRTLCRKLVEL